MKYKMLVSDFDDTLLSDDHTISRKNLEAIQEFEAQGGVFILCTGRMFRSIQTWAKRIGLKGLLACYQGGMVADIDTGEVQRLVTLKSMDVIVQLRELELAGMETHLYHGDDVYVREYNEDAKLYERLADVSCKVAGKPLSEYAAENNCDANKLMGIAEPEVVKKVYRELSLRYPHLMYVVSKPNFLEIVSPEATKARGMLEIAGRLGIKREEMIAVGDSMNDTPMIAEAGLGIAVRNALSEVKEQADVVLNYTNNEDAIAHIVYDIALKE